MCREKLDGKIGYTICVNINNEKHYECVGISLWGGNGGWCLKRVFRMFSNFIRNMILVWLSDNHVVWGVIYVCINRTNNFVNWFCSNIFFVDFNEKGKIDWEQNQNHTQFARVNIIMDTMAEYIHTIKNYQLLQEIDC